MVQDQINCKCKILTIVVCVPKNKQTKKRIINYETKRPTQYQI